MPSAGFKSVIPEIMQMQTYALGSTVTRNGTAYM